MRALTTRKLAVARYVTAGLSDKQIAARLGISVDTVAYHVAGIARLWRLDPTRNTRVLIARHVLRKRVVAAWVSPTTDS